MLGISAFYHDCAASIIISGKIFFAAQEEIFTRIKHHESFSVNAIYDMSCAAFDARDVLIKELNSLSIDFIDPLSYMKQYLERFKNESNHEDFF